MIPATWPILSTILRVAVWVAEAVLACRRPEWHVGGGPDE